MPARLLFCSLLASLAACQSGETEELAVDAQAIVNGDVVQSGYEPVVALVYQGKQFCSGTVVGRRTVVTAAHCLPPHVEVPLGGVEVFFGNRVGSGRTIRVEDGIANPSWNVNTVAGDIGVLALQDDAPVAPMPMSYLDVAKSGMLGEQALAVGFGITEAQGGGSGQKRSGMLTIDRFDASSIYLRPGPAATCNGDSGGALLFVENGREVLGGIHSRSDCGQAIIAERVDIHTLDFVTPFMEEHEGAADCGSDGMCATGCQEADPDCPCVADGICSELCAQPEADPDCSPDCPTDGVCDPSCSLDFDCSPNAQAEELCPNGVESCGDESGCSAGGSASWPLGLLLLGLVRRRRRR